MIPSLNFDFKASYKKFHLLFYNRIQAGRESERERHNVELEAENIDKQIAFHSSNRYISYCIILKEKNIVVCRMRRFFYDFDLKVSHSHHILFPWDSTQEQNKGRGEKAK